MKKIIFIFLGVLLFQVSKSQNYFPFPTDTAKWSCLYWWYVPGTSILKNYKYIMKGDTILQGKQYKKIYVQQFFSTVMEKYIGGLREDSLRQIFFFPCDTHIDCGSGDWNSPHTFPTDTCESLLYTFHNLSIGMTVPVNSGATTIQIQEIDSVLIGSQYHKRYKILNSQFLSPDYWIEGIGSTKDLLSSFSYEFEWTLYTLCFEDSITYYINAPNGSDSCHYTDSGIKEDITNNINIYPVPAKEDLTIEWYEAGNNKAISILNLQGQILLQQPVHHDKTLIDISGLANGVYILKLNSIDKTTVALILKE